MPKNNQADEPSPQQFEMSRRRLLRNLGEQPSRYLSQGSSPKP